MNTLSRFSLLFLSVLFFISTAFAQKPPQYNRLQIIPDEKEETAVIDNMKISKVTGVPVALYRPDYPVNPGTPERMAREYLSKNNELFKFSKDLSGIRYLTTTKTPGGYHVHFGQYIGEYPVIDARINVTISRDNRVMFVMNGTKTGYGIKEEQDLVRVNISESAALASARNYLGLNTPASLEKTETAVYFNKGVFRLAMVVTIVPAEELYGQWEVMMDAQTGEIFRVEDKALYYNSSPENPERVNGTGYVFDPDPITHARTTYGSTGFVDNNDADSDSLTAHRELVTLYDITFDGTNYILKGPWAEIRDFESPNTGLHTSTTNTFHFTRFNDNFEAVNVYFHIDNSMRWLNDSLGFTVHPFQYTGGVRFDPHGLSGDDNSHYIPATGSIAYGDGGVDDAEDLGVVLHELSHGIHDWVTAGGLSQVEGLSEGSCDYWATSYIRSKGYWTPAYPAYNWVFIWDGHNPFWAGRITNYTAHYPEGLTGTIHTDGQMWSSSLMSIYDQIGRVPTDRNFIQALSMTNSSSGQDDAAQAFITADQMLYGGSHLSVIYSVFTARGYVTGPIQCNFSADVTGGPGPLTVHFTDQSASQNPITSWQWDFDNNGTVDATTQNPVWTYTNFGIYSVKLTVSDGTYNASLVKTDYINVTDPNQVTDTIFVDAFSGGLGAWNIVTTTGTCGWKIVNPVYPNPYTLPPTSSGGVLAADVDDCGTGSSMNSTATIVQTFDCSIYDVVKIEFDNDWRVLGLNDEAHVEISTNGGSSWTGVWDKVGTSIRNTHEIVNISALAAGQSNVKIRLRSVQPGWDWWWVVDNFRMYGIYVNNPTTFQLSVNVINGWNMLSIPGLHPNDQNVTTWWPGKDLGAGVFRFQGGYQAVTTAQPTFGYWVKHIGTMTYNTGDEWPAGGINIVPHDPINSMGGWALIGIYECPVAVSDLTTTPPGLITGQIYRYSGSYVSVDTLYPGYGYWVKLSGSGIINVPPCNTQGSSKLSSLSFQNFGKIIITDAAQKSYTLYAVQDKADFSAGVDLNQYELPPLPPSEMFDIRFSSQRFAERVNSTPVGIEMMGVQYPIKVKAEETAIILTDETGKEIARLNAGEEITLYTAVNKLMVSENLIPSVYSLGQNYPNPFNPGTTIQFSIPEDVQNVKLIVFSSLGEKIAELVNTGLQAGVYKYPWDAGNYASGIYIYQLVTEKFVATKKMILLK